MEHSKSAIPPEKSHKLEKNNAIPAGLEGLINSSNELISSLLRKNKIQIAQIFAETIQSMYDSPTKNGLESKFETLAIRVVQASFPERRILVEFELAPSEQNFDLSPQGYKRNGGLDWPSISEMIEFGADGTISNQARHE